MFPFSRPPITQNQIPTVKKICEDLGFGDPLDKPESYLKESTQSWRKQYKTREGTLGRSLIEWRQPRTQIDLKSMTIDYLEKGGYGVKHWPANTLGILEYPKDRHRITELLTQLFWKENTNEAHNAKHPDRGRRVRESVESDQSSTTMNSPTISDYSRSIDQFAQVPRQSESKPAYPGIGVGSIPKRPLGNIWHPANVTFNERNTHERHNAASPTQSSGSLFVPSTADTEEISPTLQSSLPTLTGDSTESVVPDIPDDVYDWCDDDLKRSAKAKASKRITSSFRHPWGRSEDGGTATSVAPVAKMHTSPATSQRPPKATRPEQTTPPAKRTGAQASHATSSADSSRRRRRDVVGGDEDAEYVPQPRSKRQKATSNASDDAPIVPQPHPPAPEIETSPVRACTSAADGQCPVCFTILAHIGDGSDDARESHVDTCINFTLSSSPPAPAPEARRSHTVLPDRPRSNRPAPAALVVPNVNNGRSIPESPPVDLGHEDLIDNAQEHTRRSSTDPPTELPQPLPYERPDHVERSLPSPAPEPTTPNPPTPTPSPPHHLNPAHPSQAPPPPTPTPEINYYIIATRHPRLLKIHWPGGSLAHKPLAALFAEVAAVACKRDMIERISCKLTTSMSELQYTIARGDERIFEVMKRAFSREVNADLGRGKGEFEVEVEVEPGRVGGGVGVLGEVEGGGGGGGEAGFSF